MYFSAFTAKNGTELWQSDGTVKGTVLTADLNRGPNNREPAKGSRPIIMGSQGNHLIFNADNGQNISGNTWSNDDINELYFLPNSPMVLSGLPMTSSLYVAPSTLPTDTTSVTIAPQATVVDINGNYARSVLTFKMKGAYSGDSLTIRNQGSGAEQVVVSGLPTNRQIRVGGVLVATANEGTEETALTVRFNQAATQNAIQAVIRAISFGNRLRQPTIGSRSIEVDIGNGLGAPTKTAIVNVTIGVP